MTKLNSVHKWLVVLLVAVLATSATAGLVVTDPVVAVDENLVLPGDYYDSIIVSDSFDVYGMAAFVLEATSANITIFTPLITEITVQTTGSGAYGMYADAGVIFSNDLYGSITAVAADSAYGMDANSVVVGELTGTISATTTTGSNAVGIWGDDLVSVYSISADGAITASSAGGGAFGIGSNGITGITGAMDGTITVSGQGEENYGILGYDISIGNIGGTITVTTEGEGADGAYGIYANGSLAIGDITGSISATSDDDYAYGVYAGGNIELGDITGDITTDAGGYDAYGIWSDGDYIIIGDISGDITVTASSGTAAGITANNGSLETGDISGDITVTSEGGESFAWGLYAYDSYLETGDITGSITAYSGSSYAYGLYSESGEGGGHVFVGDVNGVISAQAAEGSDAYGIRADGVAYINSVETGGTISAVAESQAYGIYGGELVVIGSEMAPTVSIEEPVTSIDDAISAEATDGSYAYGIYSNGDVYIDGIGADGSITATAAGDYAYGIYADGYVYMGDMAGAISAAANGTAEATNGENAYGIYGYYDIEIGNISGSISATADGNDAYGIYSYDEGVFIDAVETDGVISATAAGDAYGIYADGTVVIGSEMEPLLLEEVEIPAFDGTITAETTDGSGAYGIYGSDVYIESFGANGSITATSAGDYAYGIYADDSVYIGDMAGAIAATANGTAEETGGDNAYGIYAYYDIELGDISGEVSATAAGSYAYGIWSDQGDYIGIGDISGTIAASADGNEAYAISAWYGAVYTGDISGEVSASAGGSEAYGIYAYESSVEIGDINSTGSITATASSDAYGIYSEAGEGGGHVYIGNIDGEISGYAFDGDNGYGIYADGDVDINSIGSDGEVWGTASNYDAYGIYASGSITIDSIEGVVYAGSSDYAMAIHAGGMLDTTITGEVIAETYDGDNAIAISAYDSMNILVDGGNVFGGAQYYDDEEEEYYWEPAYAIRSGEWGEGWMQQAVDDAVEIVAGSEIFGDIDLGPAGEFGDLLTLSGEDYYTGYITGDIANVEYIDIYGGTWYVLGNAYNNANGIYMEDGFLNWQGEVEDLEIWGGSFSPGNSVGTTWVMGDFYLGEDSTFVPEVDNDQNADLVDVSGEAVLDYGTIAATSEHFITEAFEVPVILAQNGIYGEFDTETFTPFFEYEVYYYTEDPCNSAVVLDITPADFTEYAVTKNQNAIGEALNDVRDQGDEMDEDTQDILAAIRRLQNEAEDGAPGLLDELAPQDAFGLAQVSAATMFAFNDSMFDRVGNVRTGRPYVMAGFGQNLLVAADGSYTATSTENEWRPFVKGIGSWGDRDGETGVSGYSYDIYGMSAGADKIVSDNWLLGVGIGGSMAKVDYDKVGTEADIDTALISLYASHFKDNWHVDFAASFGFNWYDSERSIVLGEDVWKAKSDHDGTMYSFAMQAGMNLGDETTIIEPIIGGGYTAVREKGYTEKGPLNLKVDSHTTDTFYSKLGMRLATQMKAEDNTVLVPEVGAFWIHDFSDATDLDSEFSDGTAFSVEGIEPDDTLNLTAGLNAYFSDWRLFVNYGWQTSSDADSHTVKAGVQWNF